MDQQRITYANGAVRVFGRREYPASGYYEGKDWIAHLSVGRPAIEGATDG